MKIYLHHLFYHIPWPKYQKGFPRDSAHFNVLSDGCLSRIFSNKILFKVLSDNVLFRFLSNRVFFRFITDRFFFRVLSDRVLFEFWVIGSSSAFLVSIQIEGIRVPKTFCPKKLGREKMLNYIKYSCIIFFVKMTKYSQRLWNYIQSFCDKMF